MNSERESTRSGGVSESTQVDQTTGMVSEGTAIRSDTEGALNRLQVRETVGDKSAEVRLTPKKPRNRAEHGEQTPEETLHLNKWAGRLRSRGLPKTSTRQQGEM